MRAVVSLLAVGLVTSIGCHSQPTTATPTPAPASAPQATGPVAATPAPSAAGGAPGAPGARRPRPSPAAMDTARRGMVARLLSEIAGREDQPAEKVYQNVQLLKGVPARAFLDSMNAFGRALGLTCTGCHVGGQWASDDRQNKKLAREMITMVDDLNAKQLAAMKNIDADFPRVTCAMCHRGAGHPAQTVSLEPPPSAGPAPGAPPLR